MPAERFAFVGLVPTSFEKITCSNSTAQTLNSTTRLCSVLDISVETQHVRYRFDSTAATLTTGVVMQKDTLYRWEGLDGAATPGNLTFQRSTGTVILNIMGYKYTGSP